MPTAPFVITIVGGGFAGTALAIHLARLGNENIVIHLIEPRSVPGPGLAYTARRPEYLLNVRPAALSLYPDQPLHFAQWLRAQPEAAGGVPDFAPRATYGRYLAQELAAVRAAPTRAGHGVQWHPATAETATARPQGGYRVGLSTGTALETDALVLALGNFAPPPPAGPGPYLAHPGYHADPWATGNLRRIGPDESVLLIGSGLTAVDVLLALRQDGHRGPVTVVSRHGRWPAAHGPAGANYPNFYPELATETTVAGVLRVFKRHARAAAAQGTGWRPVLDALRPDLGRIWAAWPLAEQRRFLRHLSGLWAVARHRSPPENATAIDDLMASGAVQLHLGAVREIVPAGPDLRVRIRACAEAASSWRTARHVVACTGPLLDYGRINTPLVASLRTAGALVPDALGLGIRTDAHGALRNVQGQPAPDLFTLGASRRPAYFESTAVPELRQQAAALAAELLRRA